MAGATRLAWKLSFRKLTGLLRSLGFGAPLGENKSNIA